jgi:(p)ppGpp synthase/HD superfamily hydrolase
MAVAGLVLEHGGSEDAAIAALLHDTVEDAGGVAQLRHIEATFGPKVASIVEQCSDRVVNYLSQELPWEERKRAYVAAVPTKSPDACLATPCDKLHNARDPRRPC